MKKVFLLACIVLALCSTGAFAYDLADDTGLFISAGFENDPFGINDSDEPFEMKNSVLKLGYQNEKFVTKVAAKVMHSQVEVENAYGPGRDFSDGRISGAGLELSQGFKVFDKFNVRAGGFFDYVYYTSDFKDSFMGVEVRADGTQTLRTGIVVSAEFLKNLDTSVYYGYQTFRTHIDIGGENAVNLEEESNQTAGLNLTYKFNKFGIGAEYANDLDRYSKYGLNALYFF